MADQDLSDEQIQQLLKEAEERLKNKPKQKTQIASLTTLPHSLPRLASEKTIEPYIRNTKQGMAHVDPALLATDRDRKLANGIRIVEDPITVKAKAEKEKKSTAGADWYNLPKTDLTPELKRDLQLLRMRDVLDPKRFYKKESSRPVIPEFSQVGTIIEGPTEYFTGRLSNKQRKRTLVEEILAKESETGRFKSKYSQIQEAKTSGKKAYYKKLRATRRK